MTEKVAAYQPFQIGWYGDGDLGEMLIQDILAGRKTATTSPSYDRGDTTIQAGDVLELLDKRNKRRGLLKVTRLEYRPLGEFDEPLARAVGCPLDELLERVRIGNARKVSPVEEMRILHFELMR